MSKKQKERTPKEILVDTLKEQRDFVDKMLTAYDRFKKESKLDIFPYVVLANENLKKVLDKQIELIEKADR